MPWPNRIRDARYVFRGTEYRTAISEPERGGALHGLVLWASWRPLRHSRDEVALGYMLHPQPGYPFTLELEVAYRLVAGGLEVRLSATNRGAEPAPFGAGFHPYLKLGDALLARARARPASRSTSGCCRPARAVPVAGTEYDFRRPRRSARALDACFGDLERDADGLARASLVAGDGEVSVWMDEHFHFVHVFTRGRRDRPRADDVRAGRVQLRRRPPGAPAGWVVRRPLGSQHTPGGAVMRRSSRTKLMTVGIAVVALAVASPTGAAAKQRHHGHGHGHRGAVPCRCRRRNRSARRTASRSTATRSPTGR